jgi:quercetin dioxygenase-like cupin family protein
MNSLLSSRLYDNETFYRAFEKDLRHATERVIIERLHILKSSPFLPNPTVICYPTYMSEEPYEIWEDPNTNVKFYFSHSSPEVTTGVMVIPPGKELPKHNRPLAVENAVQIAGKCLMKVFDDEEHYTEHVLEVGDVLTMAKGQYHIHANPYGETSYTLFKAVGDITAIVAKMRETFTKIEPRRP